MIFMSLVVAEEFLRVSAPAALGQTRIAGLKIKPELLEVLKIVWLFFLTDCGEKEACRWPC